jgi:hypothetical protein
MSEPFNENQFRRDFGAPVQPATIPKVQLASVFTLAGHLASRFWRPIVITVFACAILPKLVLLGFYYFGADQVDEDSQYYEILGQLYEGVDVVGYLLFGFVLMQIIVSYMENRNVSFAAHIALLVKQLVLSTLYLLGVGLGAILLIIPGLILYVLWSVCQPAMLKENLAIIRSFGRSRELVKGNFWPAFVVMGIALAVSILATFGIDPLYAAIEDVQPEFYLADIVIAVLGPWFDLPFVLLPIALYYHLVELRDGLPREPVADVFD